jgi:hypothetical protein
LTRKTANSLESLLELPASLFVDYYKKIEDSLIEEQRQKKKEIEKIKSQQYSTRSQFKF